jgi:transcriptional regulator with XRE-family HTH domain
MDYREARQRFGYRLRDLRKENRLTQEQLAELINKSTEYVSFLERGERSASFETIIDIAQAFNLSIASLMTIDTPLTDAELIENVEVAPVPINNLEPIEDAAFINNREQQTDLTRLQAGLEGIYNLQRLANEYGIHDIFQDNGGKVLQVLIILGLRISPGREGNDAVDSDGNEYELKTINISLNKNAGVTTHHHLNLDILNKYRTVKAWYIAIYESIELREIYRVEPTTLEPLFQVWEERIKKEGALNNPKISIPKYVKKGELVYPPDALKQSRLGL